MSRQLRAVKEVWGDWSDQFIRHDTVVSMLEKIALRAGTGSTDNEYEDKTVVWICDGKKFLDFLAAGAYTLAQFKEDMPDWRPSESPEGTADPERACLVLNVAATFEQNIDEETEEDVESLLGNLEVLAKDGWQTSLDKDGSLRLYVD